MSKKTTTITMMPMMTGSSSGSSSVGGPLNMGGAAYSSSLLELTGPEEADFPDGGLTVIICSFKTVPMIVYLCIRITFKV